MTADGAALIITALAALVAASATAYAAVRTARRLEITHRLVEEIDRAVNTKKPGEQSMVAQIDDLHQSDEKRKRAESD